MQGRLLPQIMVVAIVVLAAAVGWLALEVRGQSARLDAIAKRVGVAPGAKGAPGAPAAQAPAAAAAPDSSESKPIKMVNGIPADRIITYDSFARHWEPELAAKADKGCWTPLERKYPKAAFQPMVHFYLTVNADGTVAKVRPDIPEQIEPDAPPGGQPGGPDRAGAARPLVELHQCVARLIRTMRFPAPGKQTTGRVQANRHGQPAR